MLPLFEPRWGFAASVGTTSRTESERLCGAAHSKANSGVDCQDFVLTFGLHPPIATFDRLFIDGT